MLAESLGGMTPDERSQGFWTTEGRRADCPRTLIPTDRRAKIASLTPQAMTSLSQIARHWRGSVEAIISDGG